MQGVEEAVASRNPTMVREEEEEQRAAEEERRSRSALPQKTSTEKRIKILMLGDSGVGKSSLIVRWTQDSFSTDLVGTVGVNFKTRKVIIGSEHVQAQVWDTAGQEQFHKITTSYYKGANGIMLVYDVSDRKSVDNVEYRIRNIRTHASDVVQVALIGNKVDLRTLHPTQCIYSSHGQQFSAKYGVPYFETSAKDSINVEDAFCTLIANIIGVPLDGASAAGGGGRATKDITGTAPKTDKKEKCTVS